MVDTASLDDAKVLKIQRGETISYLVTAEFKSIKRSNKYAAYFLWRKLDPNIILPRLKPQEIVDNLFEEIKHLLAKSETAPVGHHEYLINVLEHIEPVLTAEQAGTMI